MYDRSVGNMVSLILGFMDNVFYDIFKFWSLLSNFLSIKKDVNSLVLNATFYFGEVLPISLLESGDRQVGIL